MIQLDFWSRTKNPTLTPSVVRNPMPTPPKSLRLCNPDGKLSNTAQYPVYLHVGNHMILKVLIYEILAYYEIFMYFPRWV